MNVLKSLGSKVKLKGVLLFILGFLLLLAVLTKTGIIPNYLNISVFNHCNNSSHNKHNIDTQDNTSVTVTPTEHHNVPIFTETPPMVRKPVIYLYPQKPINIHVRLKFKGKIIESIPEYNINHKQGWYVLAYPNGQLLNYQNGKYYKYLYWEGLPAKNIDWNLNTGFVVKGSKAKDFLQDVLPQLGLNNREIADFIKYWNPILTENKYNLIHFSFTKYEKLAQLQIAPKPDTVIRVFMVVKPLDKYVKVIPQELKVRPYRKGFTVVEWGGTVVK